MFNTKDNINQNIKIRRRINLFLIGFLLLFVSILLRLINIQIIDSEKYRYTAKKQSQSREVIIPPRGLVSDRNMNTLVSNIYKLTITADPSKIKNPDSVAILIASRLNKDYKAYLEILLNKDNPSVYLERKTDITDLRGIDTFKIDGINITKDPSRLYNFGSLGSQIIGFTDIENNGVSGIELAFNKELSGKEGYTIMQKDGKGNKRPDLSFVQREPVTGDNIVLTIDKEVQSLTEEELAEAVSHYSADKGKIVVLSVKTGEILAMTSFPTFNPNDIKTTDTIGMKNSVISDIYEPGSTFKIITAAGCLEEGLESENSVISTENGSYSFNGNLIKDTHPASSLTFQQVIEYSSNIGFAKLSEKLGQERFYKYARDFGIGIFSGIELRGENKGLLKRPIEFTNGSLEFMSIGYQISVNALQLAMAYGAIANNGMLMRPYIIKKEYSPDGKVVFESTPSPVRQVVSEQTAKRLTKLFTGVVEKGTGVDAKISGFSIAGKTGTSQRLVNGEYSSGSHNSSFIGYFPAEDPVILIAVILDNPKSGEYYGGKVAAPVFQKIATRIINYYGISNNFNPDFLNININRTNKEINGIKEVKSEYKLIPNLIDLKLNDAIEILKEKNIKFEVDGDNQKNSNVIVISQNPVPDAKININENISIKLSVITIKSEDGKSLVVPSVQFMSLRKAINKLVTNGFTVGINGSGEVIDQLPKAGSVMAPKSKIILFCKNNY
jgi:cell division protein FtsI/penicillin-binding protein 2